MRARVRTSIAPAAALLVALGVGCGGGEGTGAETTSSAPLSKKEFVKQADAICQQGLEAKDTAVQKTSEKIGAQSGGQLSSKDFEDVVVEAVVPSYKGLIGDLSELSPPVEDKATVESLIAKYESGLASTEEDPGRAIASQPFKDANKAAEAYGLSFCNL